MSYVSEDMQTTAVELTKKLFNADKEKVFVAVQISSAVRVIIGEKLGLARGEDSAKKLSFVLRLMGADAVVDTAIAQDVITLTLVKALKNKKEKGGAPIIVGKGVDTPCPADMNARLLKKYYKARENGKSVRVVAVVCCEKARAKVKGADVVLTADALAGMILETGVNLRLMKNAPLDMPFGVACGSAYICAAAGGKSEAVARCLMENKTRSAAQKLAYSGLYGKGAVREATIVADGQKWKFAVVVCPEAAEKVREDIANGVCEYDFVEFSCGGCISKGLENATDKEMTLKLRGLGLRFLDKARAARSADVNSYAALALKEWGAMVRSGEAVAENTPITEEELTPALVEEIVEETVEEVAEEVVEETVEEVTEEVVEETVEEVAEEVVEEAVEEVAEEIVEETVEEVAEEVVEETVEEVAEEIVEETVEEVAEEIVEEAVEEVAEEVVEETVEEVAEEIVEEAVEEVAEEIVEETVEEVAEEVVEEAVEEVSEEIVEEAVEEVAEEIVEETVEEVAEEVVEEAVEEVALEDASEEELAKRDPYYRRLSSKERRKLKRKNKNNK